MTFAAQTQIYAYWKYRLAANAKGPAALKAFDEKFKEDTNTYKLLMLKQQAEHPRADQRIAKGFGDFGTGLVSTLGDIAMAPANVMDSVVHVAAAGIVELAGDHHTGAALMRHAGKSMVKASDGLGAVPFVGTAMDLAVAGVAEASGDHDLSQRKLGDAATDAIADVVTVATGGVGGVAMKAGKVVGKVAMRTAEKTAVHEGVAAVEKTAVKSAQHAIISAPKIAEKTAAKAVVRKTAEKTIVKESLAKGAAKSLAKGTLNRAVLNSAFDSILPVEEPPMDTEDTGGTINEATTVHSPSYVPVLVGLGVGFVVPGGVVKRIMFGGAAATGTALVLYRQSLISH